MKNKETDQPSRFQWPPPYEDEPMFSKIFMAIAFIAGFLGLIIWAFFLFQMPLNPAG